MPKKIVVATYLVKCGVEKHETSISEFEIQKR